MRRTDKELMIGLQRELGSVGQRSLAAILGVTQPTISGVMNGMMMSPAMRSLVRGKTVELQAARSIRAGSTGSPRSACRAAAQAGVVDFVAHARDCAVCLTRARQGV